MTGRPRLLDLYCGQGGTSVGYWRAGFDVTGVDHVYQPRFPTARGIRFEQGNAVTYLANHSHRFDAVAASPPCQFGTNAQRIQGRDHPNLIPDTRVAAQLAGLPFIIENVDSDEVRKHLLYPVLLCGTMFRLGVTRHRLFEAGGGLTLATPPHPTHESEHTKMGRRPKEGTYMHVVGHFSDVPAAKRAMGIDWMTRDGLSEAIPPAFTHFLGVQLLLAATR